MIITNSNSMLRRKFRIKLPVFCLLVSLFILSAYHYPFFSTMSAYAEKGISGIVVLVSLAVLILLANSLATYLIVFPLRSVGKVVLALSFILNAVSLYFMNTYDVMLDDTMMGNVFNTDTSEATSYFSYGFLSYLFFLGVLPAILVFIPETDYGKWKDFGRRTAAYVAIILAVGLGNFRNWAWVHNNEGMLGSLLLPWSYTVNTFRYDSARRKLNRPEIKLPDATMVSDKKEALVLVIGESARRDHFSLYGYHRQTNPLLEGVPGLKLYPAESAATYTTAGVKAILDFMPTDEHYEPLPNYLLRAGADVIWRTSNSGHPHLTTEKFYEPVDLVKLYPGTDGSYDGILTEGLADVIMESPSRRVFVVLHTSTSHGPSYELRYPSSFEKFTPVNHIVELSSSKREELTNSYDNSILYTDFVIFRVIEELRSLPQEWHVGMMFISDHGESLGENKLYMHGLTRSMAPPEQYEIPFILWSRDSGVSYKEVDNPSQYDVFHSVLKFLDIQSPVYQEELNVYIK